MRTAIWKDPVDGRCRVRRLDFDGDGQDDLQAHGGEHRAVFVYQIESYRYWQRELGRGPFPYLLACLGVPREGAFYLCGPPGFMRELTSGLMA